MNIVRKTAVLTALALCIASFTSCSDGKIGNTSSHNTSSRMTSSTIGVMSEIDDIISSAQEYFSDMTGDMMSDGYVGSDSQ